MNLTFELKFELNLIFLFSLIYFLTDLCIICIIYLLLICVYKLLVFKCLYVFMVCFKMWQFYNKKSYFLLKNIILLTWSDHGGAV